jgi:UMF1 family MFS transporter
MTSPNKAPFLERLGLHRPELRAWAMYDWANSAMVTTITSAVFPIYFVSVAGAELDPTDALGRYGTVTTMGLAIIAVLAPILGTVADYVAIKKRMLATFMGLGVSAVAMMFFIQRGDLLLASALFILANIGVNGSFVFYESLLPHVAHRDEMDRVSTAAYGFGYIGGGLLLAAQLAWITCPGTFGLPFGESPAFCPAGLGTPSPDGLTGSQATLPTRLAFFSVAVWWLLFSIPLFRKVPEPPVRIESDERVGQNPVAVAFQRLSETFRELRSYRNAFLMLLAFLIYNDGIGTIVRMAGPYGEEIGIGRFTLIGGILLTQFVGFPFAFLFGLLAGRIGPKTAIYLGLASYLFITVLGYNMQDGGDFLLLAAMVGVVQGGTQALSRSLFATMIPRHKSGEFFGFWSVFEKFAGIFGPAIFTLTLGLTGSSRSAILSLIAFFVIGGALLTLVNVDEGRKSAREAEQLAGAA